MINRTEMLLQEHGGRRSAWLPTAGLIVASTMLAAVAARAEDPTQLPPVNVLAPPPATAANAAGAPGATAASSGGATRERCVDVTAGGERSFGCINQQFRKKVDETNPVLNTPPIDAKSSDLKTGVVNIPGVQQQYGKNFGNSVVPYRPPAPPYTSPMPGRH